MIFSYRCPNCDFFPLGLRVTLWTGDMGRVCRECGKGYTEAELETFNTKDLLRRVLSGEAVAASEDSKGVE